jgi:hypothetical protein
VSFVAFCLLEALFFVPTPGIFIPPALLAFPPPDSFGATTGASDAGLSVVGMTGDVTGAVVAGTLLGIGPLMTNGALGGRAATGPMETATPATGGYETVATGALGTTGATGTVGAGPCMTGALGAAGTMDMNETVATGATGTGGAGPRTTGPHTVLII